LSFDEDKRIFEIDDVSPQPGDIIVDSREYKPKILKLSSIWKKSFGAPRNCYSI
jgi:hypothetical protein